VENGSEVSRSFAPPLINLFKILAAASVGISLARYVGSVGVILLKVAVATLSDFLSVFAGPTKTLVEDSPVLDPLLVFLTSSWSLTPPWASAWCEQPFFLALFAANNHSLNLHYRATLLRISFATFLAVTAGLLLERPLPALSVRRHRMCTRQRRSHPCLFHKKVLSPPRLVSHGLLLTLIVSRVAHVVGRAARSLYPR
jgi:hypothetical protein